MNRRPNRRENRRPNRRGSLRPLALLAVSAFLAVPACGGSGSSEDPGPAQLTVTLTDSAAHDVTSFSVAITALTFKHSDGTTVVGLAHAMTVDLVTLRDVSQVLSIQGVDGGLYTSASMTLDFTNAQCFLAEQTTEATLLDDDGNALGGTVTLPIDLAAAAANVTGGRRHEIEIEFDLDQSLTIDPVANVVRVTPSVVVRTDRTDPHVNLASGALTSVDVGAGAATMDLETSDKFSLGTVRFAVNTTTIFQVDGTTAIGSAGINLLSAKPVGTWAQVFVAENPAAGTGTIFYVEAGTGTFNGGQAFVDGFILDRGDTGGSNKLFTVRGMSSNATHSTLQFNTDFAVTMTPGVTRVRLHDSSSSSFNVDSLNIGQRVLVFGTLAGTAMDATAATALVRAEPTELFAFAIGPPAASILQVDLVRAAAPLARVGPLSVVTTTTPFLWGADNPTLRDPDLFNVDVGTLGNGLNIVAATPVTLTVNFSNVNNASPDATALSLATLTADTDTLLSLRDRTGGMDVVTLASGTVIQFTLSGIVDEPAGERAVIDFGLLGVIDVPTTPQPSVVAGAAPIQFTLQDETAGTVKSFSTFATFVDALGTALAGASVLKDFVAVGEYNAPLNTLAAKKVTAVLQ